MVLLSRLPLSETEVRFLVMEEVPSIKAIVALPDGRKFTLYVVHPEPPLPFEDTLGRDGELVLTAGEIKADPLPAIVTGDLNDVAWSRTTQRFQRLSGLLDPRVGRGFFNTFDARFLFLRWPLITSFMTHNSGWSGSMFARYRLRHFPMLFELALAEREAVGEPPGQPDSVDLAEARDVAKEAARLDREPIGADWEKKDVPGSTAPAREAGDPASVALACGWREAPYLHDPRVRAEPHRPAHDGGASLVSTTR